MYLLYITFTTFYNHATLIYGLRLAIARMHCSL